MVHLAEVQRPPLPKRKKKEPLIFTDEDCPQVLSPHWDALVIKVEINNVVVHRTLVDTSSSVNIMYINTFKELGLSRGDLKPIRTPLSGFTGDTIEAEGTITVKAGFKVSNNEAEYEALLYGLRLAASLKAERIQGRCDSKLIVGHVTGEFEAKDERMKKYRDTALELLKAFEAYRIEQVPREENAEADILSKLGPDSPDHIKAMTQEEELLEPSISLGQVLVITLSVPDWIDELTMYILDESLPTDPVAAQFVKRRAPSYTLECGRLYKRSYNEQGQILVKEWVCRAERKDTYMGNLEEWPGSWVRVMVSVGYMGGLRRVEGLRVG
ncbi:unnamed protein product [Cuscuta campestris]|uniref:RNase H type-1 domain-containing protein n=1 Tax=Cuscuta campestris TaxID=132261 RepID=A0A484KFT8_9ASTE|nr:unnamed protein product [Cuscuta campestris]